MATPPIGNIDLSRGQAPYNPNMGEYLVPANRSFTWESSPQEQGLLASAMGRSDLKQLLNTGQWGPLAGQPYQYQGGRTTIGYGGGGGYPGGGLPPWQTGGYPPWQGGGVIDGPGTGGTVIIDGPGDTNGGKTYGPGGKHDNYHDWYMDRDNPFGHYWALENAARGKNRAIGEQEVASQVDQFAVNPFQGAGRNWTAPDNPYGTTAQGFRTGEQQANIDAFRKDLAEQPMGTSALVGGLGYTGQTGNEFGGMPTADQLAARQASVMPDDFGRNPFAARQAAAATPSMQFGVGGGTDYGAALAQQQRQREIAMQANEFASAQRAQQQRQTAQADAMRQALGFGTPDRSVDVSDVPLAMEWRDGRARTFQPQTSTPFAQQKAEAARIAQTKPQRDAAAAVVRQTQQRDRGGAEQKREENRKSASDRKKAQAASRQKEAQRKAGVASRSREKAKAQAKAKQLITSRQQKPSPPMKKATTTRRPPRARAASAKLAQQAAARARNIAQEKKDKKRGRRGPGMGDR